MKKMEFKVKCVRDSLVHNGYVYTVRGYDMWSEYVWVDGVGRCFRRQAAEVRSKEDLLKFVRNSGFADVELWWRAIESFCAGRKKWVYYVFIRNGVGE
jgi:hypothetical protein